MTDTTDPQTAADAEPADLPSALIELRHARAEVERLRPFVDMADQAQRDAEPAAPPTPADRSGLRERIADSLADADGWKWAPGFKAESPTYRNYLRQADAVLPVLPPAADRAASYRLAADAIESMQGYPHLILPEEIVAALRLLAAGAQPEPGSPAYTRRLAAGERDEQQAQQDGAVAGGALMRAHIALAEQAGRDQAEARFVTRVLELFSMSHADASGDLLWRVENGTVHLNAEVSDVFAWGGADCEPITPDTLPALEQAYADLKAIGAEGFTAELYTARRRGQRPQGAAYPDDRDPGWREASALYDACGPERELGLGNPKAAPAHRKLAAAPVAGQPPADTGEEADRIVAYRLAGSNLHCISCAPSPRGDIWEPVTSDDLPDGGLCAKCGTDVLIPQPKEA